MFNIVYPNAIDASDEQKHIEMITKLFSSDLDKLSSACQDLMDMDLRPTTPVHPAIKLMMADAQDNGMSPMEFAHASGSDSIEECVKIYKDHVPSNLIDEYNKELNQAEIKKTRCMKLIYKIARKHQCRIRWNGEFGFTPHYPDRFDIIKDSRIIGMIQC